MSNNKASNSHSKGHTVTSNNGSGGAVGTLLGGAIAGFISVTVLPFVPPQVHLMVIGTGAKIGNGIEKAITDSLSQRK